MWGFLQMTTILTNIAEKSPSVGWLAALDFVHPLALAMTGYFTFPLLQQYRQELSCAVFYTKMPNKFPNMADLDFRVF